MDPLTHLHAAQADVQTVDVMLEEQGAAFTLGFAAAGAGHAPQVDSAEVPPHVLHSIQSGLASGFQLATAAGPLCDEPMWGVAFEVGLPCSIPFREGLLSLVPCLIPCLLDCTQAHSWHGGHSCIS